MQACNWSTVTSSTEIKGRKRAHLALRPQLAVPLVVLGVLAAVPEDRRLNSVAARTLEIGPRFRT